MKVTCRCQHCATLYSVAEEKLGRSISCLRCRKEFTLERSDAVTRLLQSGRDSVSQPEAEAVGAIKEKKFERRQKIGSGGFGAVYEAYDTVLKRKVALKVPHPGRFKTKEDKSRVLREAEAAARLSHPNIVTVYEAGEDDESFYIASEFIQGQTLEQRASQQPLDFRQTARIVMKLAGALEYAHRYSVVHRDVKPQNVMLDANEEPKLMDFGLARLATGPTLTTDSRASQPKTGQPHVTQEGDVLGTPSYMSPEQAAGRTDIDARSDQYSLGVVLYRLICGRTPFAGGAQAVIFHVKNSEPPSPQSINPQVPRNLEAICLKAMAKEPGNRYENCAALAEDLRRWLDCEPIRARLVGPLERTVLWCRRRPVVAGLCATTMVLVGIAMLAMSQAAWQAWRAGEARRQVGEARRQVGEAREDVEKLAEAIGVRSKDVDQRTAEASRIKTDFEKVKTAAAKAETKSAWEAERARRTRYAQGLASVAALCRHDPAAGLAILEDLDRCPEDLRDFTWGHLRRLCKRQRTISSGPEPFGPLAISPDRRWLACGVPKGIKLFDTQTCQHLGTIACDRKLRSIAFSPDGSVLMAICETMVLKGRLICWRLSDFSILSETRSPVALALETSDVRDCSTIERIAEFLDGPSPAGIPFSFDVACSSDGRLLATNDNGVEVWDVSEMERERKKTWSTTSREMLRQGKAKFSLKCTLDNDRQFRFSSDGRSLIVVGTTGGPGLVASPSLPGGLVVFDTATGKETFRSRLSDKWYHRFALAPDGSKVAALDEHGLSIYDLSTGQRVGSLCDRRTGQFGKEISVLTSDGDRPYHAILEMAFSRDARQLAVGVSSHTFVGPTDRIDHYEVWLFDLELSSEWARLRQDSPCQSLAFSPDGLMLAATFHPESVLDVDLQDEHSATVIWKLATGQEYNLPRGFAVPLASTVFSRDGTMMGFYDFSRTVIRAGGRTGPSFTLWNTRDMKALASPDCLERVRSREAALAFVPDGTTLVTWNRSTLLGVIGNKKSLTLWRFNTDKTLRHIDGSDSLGLFGGAAAFSPDGKMFAINHEYDEGVTLWDLATQRELACLRDLTVQKKPIPGLPSNSSRWKTNVLAFSPDSRILLTPDGLWDVPSRQLKAAWPDLPTTSESDHEVLSALFLPDGKSVVIHRRSGVLLLDAGAFEPRGELKESLRGVSAVSVSPDGKTLATASTTTNNAYGEVRLWDPITGQERAKLGQFSGSAKAIAFSPDGKLLAAATPKGLMLWCTDPQATQPAQLRTDIPQRVQSPHLASSTPESAHAASPLLGTPSATPSVPLNPRSSTNQAATEQPVVEPVDKTSPEAVVQRFVALVRSGVFDASLSDLIDDASRDRNLLKIAQQKISEYDKQQLQLAFKAGLVSPANRWPPFAHFRVTTASGLMTSQIALIRKGTTWKVTHVELPQNPVQ